MTLYIFTKAVQIVCLFSSPDVSRTHKENCMEFYVNCAVTDGVHVSDEKFESCKKRATKCEFETEGWLECKDKR